MDLLAERDPLVIKKCVLPSLQTMDQRMNTNVAADLRHWLVEPEFSAEQRRPLLLEMSPASTVDLREQATGSAKGESEVLPGVESRWCLPGGGAVGSGR